MANVAANNQLYPGKKGTNASNTELWQDLWTGMIWISLKAKTVFTPFIPFRTLTGTNSLSDKYMGDFTVNAVTGGQDFALQTTTFNKKVWTVEVILETCATFDALVKVQGDFDLPGQIGKGQGKAFAETIDKAIAIQGMKAARTAAESNPTRPGGTVQTLSAASDADDAEKLVAGIESLVVKMKEKNAFIAGEMKLFMPPAQAAVIRNHDKVVSSQFSPGNGDFAKAIVHYVAGVEIVETNHLPTSAVASHQLSTAGNSNAFNVSAAEAKICALMLHPDALIAIQAIPLKPELHVDPRNKNTYMDVHSAITVGVRNPVFAGALYKP